MSASRPQPGTPDGVPVVRIRRATIQLTLAEGDRVLDTLPCELAPEGLTPPQAAGDPAAVQALAARGRPRFALHRGQGAWAVTVEHQESAFPAWAGTDLVAYLFKHPREHNHPVSLVARAQHEATLQQRSAALDDAEVTRRHLRELNRVRGIIESDEASAAEKQEAEEELRDLERFGAEIHHRTADGAFRTARSVRRFPGNLSPGRWRVHASQRLANPVVSGLEVEVGLGPFDTRREAVDGLVTFSRDMLCAVPVLLLASLPRETANCTFGIRCHIPPA